MSIFKRKRTPSQEDTSNFFIGSPEAEGESASHSTIKLAEVYDDFHDITGQLATEKYIVVGRKGAGKTAIAQHIFNQSKNEPNAFCDFLRNEDFALEAAIQTDDDFEKKAGLLFEWLILIRLTKLITRENNAALSTKEFSLLNKFLNKNAGYIAITDYQVNEITSQSGFNINITYLKRFFSTRFNKKIGIKSQIAPFFKLIPSLQETVTSLLLDPIELKQNNEYILLFDDLDIGVNVSKPRSLDMLMSLLRVSRNYNINYFGQKEVNVKIVIFIRDDIARVLKRQYTDSSKLFASYSSELQWYEEMELRQDEGSLKLKKFIDKRIAKNFRANGIKPAKDPWSALIKPHLRSGDKSTFRYVMERTFYTPRDLILFFKPLSGEKFRIPLNTANIDRLFLLYAPEKIAELKNELRFWYSASEVESIFQVLEDIVFSKYLSPFQYDDIYSRINSKLPPKDPDEVIKSLFEYSLIGNYLNDGQIIQFKNREPRGRSYEIVKDQLLIMHRVIVMVTKGNVV